MAMRVGDWVEVRSEAEILQTLDEHGRLEGMPFMPEMFRFCGQRLQILKSAHKTCDTISHQSYRLTRTVHLDVRCSGRAHGGCQSGCLLFWKEAWLRPANIPDPNVASFSASQAGCASPSSTTERDILDYAVVQEGGTLRYRCQSTQIRDAGTRLPWWNLWQYLEDVRSGNVGGWTLVCGALRAFWLIMSRRGFAGRVVRWTYDHVRFLWNGEAFPCRVGRIPKGQRTPVEALNLQPGELVRVRSLSEIDETLDTWGQNRGLYFDPEQAPYADHVFRVSDRVERMINEETGRMIELRTPTVVLESVFCRGRHSSCRMFCPKSAPMFWREMWLERVGKDPVSNDGLHATHTLQESTIA